MKIRLHLEITRAPEAHPFKTHWLGTISRAVVYKLIATGVAGLLVMLIDKLKDM